MKTLISRTLLTRLAAMYLVVAVLMSGVPLSASAAVTVDVKANGSDGPVTITSGASYDYTWTSTGATVCEVTSPFPSNITLNGNSSVASGDAFYYPTLSTPVTITVTCNDNGLSTSTDSVVINLAAAPAVTTDIKANGSDGPVTLANASTSYTYTWASTGATTCQITSPFPSNVTLNGNSSVNPGDAFYYPTLSTPVTITFTCNNNGTATSTDSVVINLPAGSGPTVTADIKANGSDGPVTLADASTTYTYTWASTGATTCQITSPFPSNITLNGNSSVNPGDAFYYPTLSTPVTITFTCNNNGVATATDSVVIQLVAPVVPPPPAPTGGGGGGGGSSSSSSAAPIVPGEVLGASTYTDFCPYLRSYMRMGYNNDTLEVIKLQAFLKTFEHFDYVTINGVYDQATFQAVSEFQLRYKDEVLRPWEISAPTGYAYIRTVGKINQILCGSGIPNVYPSHYKAPIKDKEMGGYKEGKEGMTGTTTLNSIPVVGQNLSKGHLITKNDPESGLAGALFSWPATLLDTLQCLYELLLILIVLYVIGTVLESVLYKDNPENVLKRFYTKWGTFALGLLVAFFIAYVVKEWCLLLPLLIAFVAVVVRTFFSPKREMSVIVIEKK